jgi:hypothetical protein
MDLLLGEPRMSDKTLDLSFRETMTGGFALGASDPEAGRQQGERAGEELTIHATVLIRDLDRFLDDPKHKGGLSGTIDFPPFGSAMPASTGTFNLFSPGETSRFKLMVYELGFAHGGKSYYLAGRKEVRNDPGFDLWKDTTTLFTRLHAGSDAGGPVVGAGTLSLGVGALIRMLGTVQVMNAGTPAKKAEALMRFGRFFLGELWDTYGPHLGRTP